MKKLLFTSLFFPLSFFFLTTLAQQAPQKFNYQAVARDADGKALAETEVNLRIAIVSGNDMERPVYAEDHTVTTNKLGLFNLAIGDGEVMEGEFSAIDWGSASHYLSSWMDVDNSGRFQELGTSQLLSVPYALYAARSGTSHFEEGETRSDPNDWTMNGNVGTDDAINFLGTLDEQDLAFRVNDTEALRLTTDGLMDLPEDNAISFAGRPTIHVGGTRNISVGENAGSSVGASTGSGNAFIGYGAGNSDSEGSNNAFIGYQAGYFNTTGSGAAIIGYRAGFNNTTGINNAFIGNQAGFNNTTGDYNAFIGYQSGYANSSAARSVMIGHRAGFKTTTGGENSFIGYLSGFSNTTGTKNTYVGRSAGYLATGNFNTYLGSYAGETTTSGTRNTFIGYESGGSNALTNATAIGAGATVTQDSSIVLGNSANVGIGTSAPEAKLHVIGDLRLVDGNQSDGYVLTSDSLGNASWVSATALPVDTFNILSDADGDTRILAEESTDEDHLRFYASGTEVITVTSDGEVSIGRSTETITTAIIESNDSGSGTSNDGCGTGCYGDANWQSFTLEEGETVEYIDLYFEGSSSNTNSVILDIALYQGGTGSTLIYQATGVTLSGFQNDDWVTVDIPDFVANSGLYTISLSESLHWYASVDDSYNGGYAGGNPNTASDYYFRVYGLAYNDNYVKVTSSGLEVGDYMLPYEDGASGQVLTTDGSGVISWADTMVDTDTDDQTLSLSGTNLTIEDGNTVDLSPLVSSSSDTMAILSDADNDTRIQVEESADEDIIRFDMAGTEFFRMDSGRLEVVNTGASLFLGEFSGANDDFSFNFNTGLGHFTLNENEIGAYNVAIGAQALQNGNVNNNTAVGYWSLRQQSFPGTVGDENTALGYKAGYGFEGSNSVLLGAHAGESMDGDNKLYIENSNADSSAALIYGEFDNDFLAINGTLRINDGTQSDGYVLTSDADGNASWTAASSPIFQISSGVVFPGSAVDVTSDDFVFGSTQLDDDGNSSHDSRFFYNKDYAAFRAGLVDDESWDQDSTGIASFASGYNTKASGDYSTAMGFKTTASGHYSTVLGRLTTAEGSGSTALGTGATASGSSSTAIGYYTSASASKSTAMGDGSEASGNTSTAMGSGTTASASYSTAMGYQTLASGYSSVAMGYGTSAPSGYETSLGVYNTQYTPNATSGWDDSDRIFGIGNGENSANRSDAMVVLKNGNTGIGISSPSATLDVVGTLQYVDGTQADGYVLTADASGNASWQAPATADELSDADGDTRIQLEESADEDFIRFDVGGTEAMVIDTAGNVGVGTDSPTNRLTVYSTIGGDYQGIRIANPRPVLILEDTDANTWKIEMNAKDLQFTEDGVGTAMTIQEVSGNVGIGATNPSYTLQVNGTAAKTGGGSWTATSDRRLKQDINEYSDGLEALMQIRPVTYHYNEKSGYDTDPEYVGVIAQELQEIAPYMVGNFEKDGVEYLNVDNSAMTYMLINAVKELKAENDALKAELSAEKSSNAERLQRLEELLGVNAKAER